MNEREAEVRKQIEDATKDFFEQFDAAYKEQYDRAEAAVQEAVELRERVAAAENDKVLTLEALVAKDRRLSELTEALRGVREALAYATHPTERETNPANALRYIDANAQMALKVLDAALTLEEGS